MTDPLTIQPGNYVRLYIPGRQRLVPCQVEARTEKGGWQCRPLKKSSVDRYIVPDVQIISKIDPKEITHPCPPQSERGTSVPPHPQNGIKNTENDHQSTNS